MLSRTTHTYPTCLARVPARVASRVVATHATEKTSVPLNICFVSAEVAPWSKTGGLGDVVGGLPIELVKRGHSVISVSPRYDQYADGWDTAVSLTIDGEQVRFFHTLQKGVHRVFVDHPWFLAKVWGKTGSRLYGARSGADYLDNHKRFCLFNKAAIEAVRLLPFGPGEKVVFVANDWHSALVPVLIRDHYQPRGEFRDAKTALIIHNIAFQGRMWAENYVDLNLPEASLPKFAFTDGYSKVYTEESPMEEDEEREPPGGKLYAKINWLQAGILSTDKLLTVSPNYALEISADAAGGVELDGVINQVGGAEGIVNGMDIEEWNPKTDKYLTLGYDDTTVFAGKAAAKQALQLELGLELDPAAPLFVFIGRLEEQKGVDIMLAALPAILAAGGGAQVVVLGTGKAGMEVAVAGLDALHPRAKGVVKFSAPLAHLMTAGGDFILVPSRFEPCGLIQLHAMHYGTVPLVASTGGLVDTVKEGVTGLHMGKLDPDELLQEDAAAVAGTVARAVELYPTPLFAQMVRNCIGQDLSWAKPARRWEGILEALCSGSGDASSASDSRSAGSVKAAGVKVPIEDIFSGAPSAVQRSSGTVTGTVRVAAKEPVTAAPAATAAAAAATSSPGTAAAAASAIPAKPQPAPASGAAAAAASTGGATPKLPASNGTSAPAAAPPLKPTAAAGNGTGVVAGGVTKPLAAAVSEKPVTATAAPAATKTAKPPVTPSKFPDGGTVFNKAGNTQAAAPTAAAPSKQASS
ncbi:MAG: hypothetical protein WDW36_002825 [Sanguina aurantia]